MPRCFQIALGTLLLLAFPAVSQAALSPVNKVLKTKGQEQSLRQGPVVLNQKNKLLLRFRATKQKDRTLVIHASSAKNLRLHRIVWRHGKIVKSLHSIEVPDFQERIRLEVGSLQKGAFVISSSQRLRLQRIPFMIETPLSNVVAVGDIACSPDSSQWNGGLGTESACRAADVREKIKDEPALLLGDIQYPSGTLSQFQAGFAPVWGSVDAYPVPGNHEYYTSGATGYFQYFAEQEIEARVPRSFWIGDWKILALDSNCDVIDCSDQAVWLEEEMQTDMCTLAFWHHPPLSSGMHGANENIWNLWNIFSGSGGDVLLTGHDHHYERFQPLGPGFEEGSTHSFVVGTGGYSLREIVSRDPRSAYINDEAYGLLRIGLRPQSFSWQWDGSSGQDQGSDTC